MRLEYAIKLSDKAISALVEVCHELRVVELIECPNVTGEGVLALANLKSLEKLTLDSLGAVQSPNVEKILQVHARALKSLSLNK